MSVAATPFRILQDENDYSHIAASTSKSARKGLSANVSMSTPVAGKSVAKASTIAPKSQRKALGNLTTGNLNARSTMNSGAKGNTKVLLSKPHHHDAEDDMDPLDMLCSGGDNSMFEDTYDQVLARAAKLKTKQLKAFDIYVSDPGPLEDLPWGESMVDDLALFGTVDSYDYDL